MVEPPWAAVLFDLDGTLLELSMDKYLDLYLDGMAEHLSDVLDPAALPAWVEATVQAVVLDTRPEATNEEVFWRHFESLSGVDRSQLTAGIGSFHHGRLPGLAHLGSPAPGGRQAVDAARANSKYVALATQPLYPAAAIAERIRWAGLAPEEFNFITSFENMNTCKPWPQYYEAILHTLAVEDPGRVLMVGNDPILDMAAGRVGIRTFLLEPPPGRRPAMEVGWLSAAGQGGYNVVPTPTFCGQLADVPAVITGGP